MVEQWDLKIVEFTNATIPKISLPSATLSAVFGCGEVWGCWCSERLPELSLSSSEPVLLYEQCVHTRILECAPELSAVLRGFHGNCTNVANACWKFESHCDRRRSVNLASEAKQVFKHPADDVKKDHITLSFLPRLFSISNVLLSCISATSILKRQKQLRRKNVRFDQVTVYYFARRQGFTSVPSQGGSSLGMAQRHNSVRRYTLGEFAQEQEVNHREILREHLKEEKLHAKKMKVPFWWTERFRCLL